MTVDGDFVLEMMLYPYEWTLQEHRPRLLPRHLDFAIRAIRIVTPPVFVTYNGHGPGWIFGEINGTCAKNLRRLGSTATALQNDECDLV